MLQLSPLGPLLFIIYVNNIVNTVIDDDVFCNMYADDTVVLCNGKTVTDACDCSSQMLIRISQWCEKNKIALKDRHW